MPCESQIQCFIYLSQNHGDQIKLNDMSSKKTSNSATTSQEGNGIELKDMSYDSSTSETTQSTLRDVENNSYLIEDLLDRRKERGKDLEDSLNRAESSKDSQIFEDGVTTGEKLKYI